jgi:photosystem II stability/assembly factor-like uncharacterized protein
MKTKLIILLVFMVRLAFSQNTLPVLGTDYKRYVREMEAYYQSNDKGKGSGYKQFRRWKTEMDSKVGVQATLQNFSAIDFAEFEKLNRANPPNARVKATHGLWEDLGPKDFSGSDVFSNNALARLNCVAFHPTNANIIWVGTPAGGLWKTTDHGGTWNCITNNFASCGISDIVVDSNNTNIIYILTGDGDSRQTHTIGVMKTTDGGLTWKQTGLKYNVSDLNFGFCLRMHPTNHNILLAGMYDSIQKTENGGDTWTPVSTNIWNWDIEFKPGDPTIIYSANWSGISKSTNTGNSFLPSNISFPIDPAEGAVPRKTWVRLSLAISPSAPNNVYVLCGGVPANSTFSGFYKSTSSGNSWTLMSSTPNILGSDAGGGGSKHQAGYDLALEVDPINDSRVFIGGVNCWKSDNNGVSWSRETNWQRGAGAVDPFVHADFHALKFRGNRLYACNDGGIYYTDDYGHSWGDISSGIGATQFYNISIDGTSYIGGTQDNGTNEATFGNLQMHNINGGDGFGAIWHNTNHSIQFLTSQDAIARRQLGSNIYIYQDSDKFWNCILKNDNDNNGILWAIHGDSQLIRGNQMNDISFATWNWYDSGNSTMVRPGLGVMGYSQGDDNANIMYVAHYDTLMRSNNAYGVPATWSYLPHPEPGLTYDDILTDPTNSQKVWVVCSGYQAGKKVYKSVDGGQTWTNISGSLPNVPVYTIALLPSGGDKLYIGTSIGVFYRSSLFADWAYYSNGLPNVPVKDIRLSSSHVYAGTFGRGIWRSELYSSCPPTLALTPANETVTNIFAPGTQVHSASISLTSTRIYNGSVGTNINYNAANFVELKEGFEIKKDAYLEVKNKGCPD